MTFLYLIRHGEALHPAIDPARGLNEHGFLQVQQLASELFKKKISPTKIFYSDKKRSQQTAEIIAKILNIEQKLELLPLLNPDLPYDRLLEFLKNFDENAIFVGHLPNIELIAHSLIPFSSHQANFSFSTASVIALEKNHDQIKLDWLFEPN